MEKRPKPPAPRSPGDLHGSSKLPGFTFDGDHPEIFASQDNGATPAEMVLVALAGCLTAGVAAVATRRGVQLRSVT